MDELSTLSTAGDGTPQRGGKSEHFPVPSFLWGAEEMDVLCSGVSVQPQETPVSKEDSLAEPRPRLESWSSIPSWGTESFSMHTESSSLHTQDTELSCTVHITCVPTGIYRKTSAVFSLSLPPLPPPSLSTDVTESYVKSGRSYYAKNFTSRACPLSC